MSSDGGDLVGLERAVADFGKAWAAGDLAALRGLLSPEYTHTDAFGARHACSDWLAYVAGRKGRGTQIKFRDLAYRRLGDVAIVTGVNEISGGGARTADDTQDLTIAFLQVWRWQEGRWLREAFQATPVLRDARQLD